MCAFQNQNAFHLYIMIVSSLFYPCLGRGGGGGGGALPPLHDDDGLYCTCSLPFFIRVEENLGFKTRQNFAFYIFRSEQILLGCAGCFSSKSL